MSLVPKTCPGCTAIGCEICNPPLTAAPAALNYRTQPEEAEQRNIYSDGPRFRLWKFFNDEHRLTLLETQLDDIVDAVNSYTRTPAQGEHGGLEEAKRKGLVTWLEGLRDYLCPDHLVEPNERNKYPRAGTKLTEVISALQGQGGGE